jgi:hypothetical protein
VLAVKATVKAIPEKEYKTRVPGSAADDMYEWLRFMPEFGCTGGKSGVQTPRELGIETTSLERWFKSEDWGRVL